MLNLDSKENADEILVGNYAVGFVDLLGQRAALRGQSLLPSANTDAERKELFATLKASVGSISALQQHAETMLNASGPNENSKVRAQLSPEMHEQWDELQKSKVTTQRWSDGLMLFSNLGDTEVKCQLNNVYRLFTLLGTLCFIGLASKRPLRGAIEVSWGVELHPGELYGAAVARAYELESEVADYPRIVIGPHMLRYLDVQCENPGTEHYAVINRELAVLCRKMLIQDADGHWLLHYLGTTFINTVTHKKHAELYAKAKEFALSQLKEHQSKQNTKLAFRYMHLIQYINAHQPP
jgi:hypothetical protein